MINFEINADKVFLKREIYMTLDFLSDVGGIQGLFISLFAVVTTLFNRDYFEENLVSQLYTYRSRKQSDGLLSDKSERGGIPPSKQSSESN